MNCLYDYKTLLKSLRQKRWRLIENKQFGICPTYGQYLVVPESCRDDVIVKAAKGRDGSRFPVLSCLAGNSHNPLMRSASLGFVDMRSTADEELLKVRICEVMLREI